MRPYSDKEIQLLKELKRQGATIDEIDKALKRSYWSIVYKWKEVNCE
jgi:transposase